MIAHEPISIGNLTLRNRVIRSATYEGCCDEKGFPRKEYYDLYEELAKGGAGAIITGFAFTSLEGRAMQANQAGIESDGKISFYKELTSLVHRRNCPIFMQISHAGRQTSRERAGGVPGSASAKKSLYFRIKPKEFTQKEIQERIEEYALSAFRARDAGFDGVQIHAAHGYLVHQFLLPAVNKRKDIYGINPSTKLGTRFLEEVINLTRKLCGNDFPILVKISGGVDLRPGFNEHHFVNLISFLDRIMVDGIEISYGTMDHALNIFRGDFPVDLVMRENPFFNKRGILRRGVNKLVLSTYYRLKLKEFSENYNLKYAWRAKGITSIPIISIGGFRNLNQINDALEKGYTDIVGMSRPFINEPDLVMKMTQNHRWESGCDNCNYCAVMCDSGKPTICYHVKKRRSHGTVQ
jgi:2,4-dienoyl-CoA reductase-like NADH-dependent reductase (Old Yellow Enzyme family)